MVPSCLVDTKFVRTAEPHLSPWECYNVNKKAYGILYQVTVSLGKPYRILRFEGPFKGAASDVSIIIETLIPSLLSGEKVMCDKGYLNEDRCLTPPKGKFPTLDHEGRHLFIDITRVRQLNERVIGRLCLWGCFSKKWSLSFELHQLCANAAAKLTQLELYLYPLT
jgi:hypothetical protein